MSEGKDIVIEGGQGSPREVLWNLFQYFHISKRGGIGPEIYDFTLLEGKNERIYDTHGLVELIAKNFESEEVRHSPFAGEDDIWVTEPKGDLKTLLDEVILKQEKEFLAVMNNFTVEKGAKPNTYAIKLNADAKPNEKELWNELITGVLRRFNNASVTSHDQSQQQRLGTLYVRTTDRPYVAFLNERIDTQKIERQ